MCIEGKQMILGIYGAGGEGREVKEAAEAAGKWKEIVFLDDTVAAGYSSGCRRMPFKNFCDIFQSAEAEVIIALGEPSQRALLYGKVKAAGYSFANVIHPLAFVSPSAQLGNGVTVKMGVSVSAGAVIGDNVGLGIQSVVSHDSVVGAGTQISPHAIIAGNCEIGDGTFIGIHACIRERVSIGAHCIIGMGAVVTKDVPAEMLAYGNPAKIVRCCAGEKVFH